MVAEEEGAVDEEEGEGEEEEEEEEDEEEEVEREDEERERDVDGSEETPPRWPDTAVNVAAWRSSRGEQAGSAGTNGIGDARRTVGAWTSSELMVMAPMP